jgi:ankyrin repeat protein
MNNLIKFLCLNALLISSASLAMDADLGFELRKATRNGKLEKVKELLSAGAPVNAQDNCGTTPLQLAIWNHHIKTCKLLVAYNAQVNSSNGGTLLGLERSLAKAASEGDQEFCELLLRLNAQVDAQGEYNKTPLMIAAEQGHKEVLQLLIANNANIHAKTTFGWAPFMYAALYGNPDICKLLLDHKAEVDATDNEGKTPLMLAAAWDKKEVCQLLLDHNAQVYTKNNNGETPLMEATWRSHKVTFPLLIDAQIKKIKATAITLLGIQKFRKGAFCIQWIGKDITKLLTRQIVDIEIEKLFMHINALEDSFMKGHVRTYAKEKLKLEINPKANQKGTHE